MRENFQIKGVAERTICNLTKSKIEGMTTEEHLHLYYIAMCELGNLRSMADRMNKILNEKNPIQR